MECLARLSHLRYPPELTHIHETALACSVIETFQGAMAASTLPCCLAGVLLRPHLLLRRQSASRLDAALCCSCRSCRLASSAPSACTSCSAKEALLQLEYKLPYIIV